MSGNKQKDSKTGALLLGATFGAIAAGVTYLFFKTSEEKPQEQRERNVHVHPSMDFRECAICLDNIGVTVLPCGHVFHSGCMKKAEEAKGKMECPLCRRKY